MTDVWFCKCYLLSVLFEVSCQEMAFPLKKNCVCRFRLLERTKLQKHFLTLWQVLAHLLGLGTGTFGACVLAGLRAALLNESSTAIKTHPAGFGSVSDKGL